MNDLFFALVVKYCDLCDWLAVNGIVFEFNRQFRVYIYLTINGITTTKKLESKGIVLCTQMNVFRLMLDPHVHVREKWQIVKWRKLDLRRFTKKKMENLHWQLATVTATNKSNRSHRECEWKTMMSILFTRTEIMCKSIKTKNKSNPLMFAVLLSISLVTQFKNKCLELARAKKLISFLSNELNLRGGMTRQAIGK